jgi:flavin reductase (DIM6/NTAB) family NADH-FMN oxidoreductase RutF
VIAVPAVDLSQKTVEIGVCSGHDMDKFKKFELTPVNGKIVKAPLIAECLANIECRVSDYIEKHNIFVLDGVCAWIDPDRKEHRTFHAVGDGHFIVDGDILDYRKLMASKLPPGV